MKKSISLRKQIFGLMALLMLLQSLALLCALQVSRVYSMLDAEAFRLFGSTAVTRAQEYSGRSGKLVADMAQEAQALGQALGGAASQRRGRAPAAVPAAEPENAAAAVTDALLRLLDGHLVTGAFFVPEAGAGAAPAVYLRNTAPESAVGAAGYMLEIGPSFLAQDYHLPLGINWELRMPDAESQDYFTKPLWAATQYPGSETERYGYWSAPLDILGDGQQVISFTLPVSVGGELCGVLGAEFSLSLLGQLYLPTGELPYRSSFYAIALFRDNMLELDGHILGGPIARAHLQQEARLPLTPVRNGEFYEACLPKLGDMYCSVHPLSMYSRNSPFYEESWALIGFVPQAVLHESSSGIRTVLSASIILTTALSFLSVFLLTLALTRRIAGLSRSVRALAPYRDIHFNHTGIEEIDDLTAAVERLSRQVLCASKTTSKILGLTLMPIGGFELLEESEHVVLTEYIYRLLGRTAGSPVSKEAWGEIYARLTAQPAEELEDTYRYDDGDSPRWLRILETPSETGRVGIILDVTKDAQERLRLTHELDYDSLTHLYNRAAFKREATQLMRDRPGARGAMIFADLDNLKYINDRFGHDMGDRLIIRAGEMFRAFEAQGGVVSRISGDEFAIYLHGATSREALRRLIDRQYQEAEAYALRLPDGSRQKIRCSSGIAFYPDDSDNATDLLKLADFAMYEAKHSRKGTVLEFDRVSYNKNIYLLENREAINRLLDEELIHFSFQPIVELRTGEIYAYEALMRPMMKNFRTPLEVLSVAAAQSKLAQLERLVLFKGFQFIHEHLQELGDRKVFLNSIPSQMLSEEEYRLLTERYAAAYGNAVIEITETEIYSSERFEQKLRQIRDNKMGIAVDDFGSGYSNELRILSMAPDIVKVDMALVSGIDSDPDKQLLVANLLSFCRPKGIRLVAEGVERREELEKLMEMGVDFVQGFYVARPDFKLRELDPKKKREILLQAYNQSAGQARSS